jgi:trk system potassium uptake protein TrkH
VLRLLVVAPVLGCLLMMFSAAFLPALAWSVAVGDGMHRVFAGSALGCLALGLAIWWATRGSRREMQPRDGALLVVFGWLLVTFASMPPLLFACPELSLAKVFMETMSGLTTTGATVLSGLDNLPQSVNLWRHTLQWFGGMGIIVMVVAVLPLLGVGGMQLFRAETPGPMKEGKLTPRITQTAKYMWAGYVSLTVLCGLALWGAGMSPFDALCHALSTVSLGGFSTRDASIGAFDSLRIEIVLAVFMVLSTINFGTHFLALRSRSVSVYLRDLEASSSVLLILVSAVGITALLAWEQVYDTLAEALRHGVFNTISVATSTGFMTRDYAQWPLFAPLWMIFLACVASSAGSTGGGIKMVRALILLKQAARELKRLVHPHAVFPLSINGSRVDERVIYSVFGFMLLWGVTQVTLTFVLVLTGVDFDSALSAVVASVNNLGPALGRFGPAENFSTLTDFQAVLLASAMLAGRLELLTFFAVLTPAFWRR